MIDKEEEIDGTNTLFEDSMNEIIQNSSNELQEESNKEENPMQESVIAIASNEGSNQTIEIDNGEGQIIDLSKQLANEAIEAATIELQEELEMEMQGPSLLTFDGTDETIASATAATHGRRVASEAVLACVRGTLGVTMWAIGAHPETK